MKRWRAVAWIAVMGTIGLTCLVTGPAMAQDPTPDELRKMYDDALAQLKAAQDRRSELAAENEKLVARVAQLEQELNTARRELGEIADKTFFLRSYVAAWRSYIDQRPDLKARWDAYLAPGLNLNDASEPANAIYDPDWPLSTEQG